jgi:transposase
MPDWAWVNAELRRPCVTLALLWQEYRLVNAQGFQYSWFCEHYRPWASKVDVVRDAIKDSTSRRQLKTHS